MNFLACNFALAHIIITFWISLPCSSAFFSPIEPRSFYPSTLSNHHEPLYHFRLAMISDSSISDDNDNESTKDDEMLPASVQDLRSFLTQRCIQSFMFLLASTRDLHTVSWLDNFTQPITINLYDWDIDDEAKPGAEDTFRENDKRLGSKLLNYHGLSALNTTRFPTWDSFFTELLEQPDTVLMISTPKDVGRRLYSEIDIDIEPARLCTRILSVREQIARELSKDLKVIAKMGQQIFDSYRLNRKNRKDTKQSAGTGDKDEESTVSAFDSPSAFYLTFDPNDDDAFAPSPLRKSNFDLLYNLITLEAIVQLVEDGVVLGEDEAQNKVCSAFLEQYYKDRLNSHFIGSQWYGKADDFIEGLMLSSPLMLTRNNDEDSDEKEQQDEDSEATRAQTLEIEPLRIAEQILLKRDSLALDWMTIMEDVPSDHTDIRKAQLDRLTGKTNADSVKIVLDEWQ
mmetsp:Transcript_14584/g.24788  ORF Transcript_14584/g.24788 Transcript_14584/m.24788 type:complete len:456 (+) Transcript_14584:168-1535(+)